MIDSKTGILTWGGSLGRHLGKRWKQLAFTLLNHPEGANVIGEEEHQWNLCHFNLHLF